MKRKVSTYGTLVIFLIFMIISIWVFDLARRSFFKKKPNPSVNTAFTSSEINNIENTTTLDLSSSIESSLVSTETTPKKNSDDY
jgi:ABC-type bacteriocin/lantibiotic exporter with double-glycine peptidase domain